MKKWLTIFALMLAACGSDTTSESSSNNWNVGEDLGRDSGRDMDSNNQNNIVNNQNNVVNNQNNANNLNRCIPEPDSHRAAGSMCDDERNSSEPTIDDNAPASCMTSADCVDGANGRCTGNSHDGWGCTYDLCFADADCGDGVCECGGGFRSDANVCVRGDCEVDSDCGDAGYCSPTFGDCGNYIGTIGYFCHTCEDECVNDSDCGNDEPNPFGDPYCAYDPARGLWACSNQHCAG